MSWIRLQAQAIVADIPCDDAGSITKISRMLQEGRCKILPADMVILGKLVGQGTQNRWQAEQAQPAPAGSKLGLASVAFFLGFSGSIFRFTLNPKPSVTDAVPIANN